MTINSNHPSLRECKEKRINSLKQKYFYGVCDENSRKEELKICISKPKSIYEYSQKTIIYLKGISFEFVLNENLFFTKIEAVEYLKSILKEELDRTFNEFTKYKCSMDKLFSNSEDMFFDVENQQNEIKEEQQDKENEVKEQQNKGKVKFFPNFSASNFNFINYK